MTGRTHFVAFGFPVHFRISVLIASVAAVAFLREIGVILVIALALSILVHELCHSLAFRRYGTESHIVVHLFGGYSSPDAPQRLSHRNWVVTALAGPIGAFLFLGLPALILSQFDTFYFGYKGTAVRVLIYFNVYWGALNLLPIWPLDGGRVLYHGTNGNWQLTKVITLGLTVPVFVIAMQMGYRFVAIFAAFNAYQVFTSPPPGMNPLVGNSRVNDASDRAGAYAAQPTKTKGAAGDEAVLTVYRELIRGRSDRAAEPLEALRRSKQHQATAEVAYVWGEAIAGRALPAGTATSPLLSAVLSGDPAAIESVLRAETATIEAGAALKVMHQRGLLDAVSTRLASDLPGSAQLRRLERLALDLGLVDEQIRITAALTGL